MHVHTRKSTLLEELREGPKTRDGLSVAIGQGASRDFIAKLLPPSNATGKNRGTNKKRAVYYIYGDDRRAVRKFIEVNEEYVKDCLEDSHNPMSNSWDPMLYQMLKEEWQFEHEA